MPFATFIKVREVSSEDNVHLAENLIKSQPNKKWKTKNAGEKSAYVILEMSGSYQITGIDLGNEHSAFVEVLVGKSACAPDEFKEILITCSFMTPTESKNSINTNRVRCFNREALVPNVAEEKWSLVKILCTQPFNKHVSYGLSFIKVHINDNTKSLSTTQKNIVPDDLLNKKTQVVGKFKFREDSPDSESEKCSSLFNRWKNLRHCDNEQTTAASIRISSRHPITLTPCHFDSEQKHKTLLSVKKDNNIQDRNREQLLFGNEADDTSNKNQEKLERFSKQIETDKKRRRFEIEINTKKIKSQDCVLKSFDNLPTMVSNSISENNKSGDNYMSLQSVQNRSSPESPVKKIKSSKVFRSFNQLLKDVILVISGIPNPDRGILRSKAIALGAKYKADWDSTCTHLICAFKNTPKYNQVKGKGKIVTRSWIEKCYSSKKYLPWRRFALDSKELSKSESDEEIFNDTLNSETNESFKKNDLKNTLNSVAETEDGSNTILKVYGIDNRSKGSYHNSSSSESDTDDEIKRIEQNIKAGKTNATSKIVDIYEAATDEEEYITEKLSQNM